MKSRKINSSSVSKTKHHLSSEYLISKVHCLVCSSLIPSPVKEIVVCIYLTRDASLASLQQVATKLRLIQTTVSCCNGYKVYVKAPTFLCFLNIFSGFVKLFVGQPSSPLTGYNQLWYFRGLGVYKSFPRDLMVADSFHQ